MAATGKVIGTVTSVVGEAKATAPDGTVRVLQVGDLVHSDEVITTAAGGAVNIALENGRSLDCSGDTSLALHESILGVATAVTTPAATPGTPGSDVAALQAAIQSGQDPSQVAPATAAGGAPAAGGAGDGGGGSPVILEQANTSSVVSSGFPTQGDTIAFPVPEFELLPIEPSVSVAVQVEVQVEVEVDVSIEPNVVNGPPEGGVFAVSASGDAVSLVEGTAEGTMEIPFVITLSEVFDTDVQVTYQIVPASADNPTDFFDGELIQTITIPAGESSFIVPIQIVRDHFVEGNESFSIVLIDAVNATINPAQSSAMVTIFNDDLPPLAQNDTYTVAEGGNGGALFASVLTRQDSGESIDDSPRGPDEGMVVISTGSIATAQGGLVNMNADGTFTYQPPSENFNGTDSFTYTMRETHNGVQINASSSATVTINVTPVNDAPVAVDDFDTMQEDALVNADGSSRGAVNNTDTESVLTNDSDVDNDDLDVVQTGVQALADLDGDGAIDDVAGTITFIQESGDYSLNLNAEAAAKVQALDSGESLVLKTQYQATDGAANSNAATLTITVAGNNDAPVAVDDFDTMQEDDLVNADGSSRGAVNNDDTQAVLTNDSDPDNEDLDVVQTSVQAFADLDGDGAIDDVAGTITFNQESGDYSLELNAAGAANVQGLDSGESLVIKTQYQATDGDANSNSATLTITVAGSNDAPVAVDDFDTMQEDDLVNADGSSKGAVDNAATESVLSNDSDPDNEDLDVVQTGVQALADLDGDGAIDDVAGTITFIQESGDYSLELNEEAAAKVQSLDTGESLVIEAQYQATDGDANSNVATLTINVAGNDDPMNADDDEDIFTEDEVAGTVSGATNVLDNDDEVDTSDQPLTVQDTDQQAVFELDSEGNLTEAVAGSITFDSDGTYQLTLNAEYMAKAQELDDGESFRVGVVYTARNAEVPTPEMDEAVLRITIEGVDDPMIAVNDAESFDEDAVTADDPVSGLVNVLANDEEIDTDDQPLTVVDTDPQELYLQNPDGTLSSTVVGTITIDSDGTYSFELTDAYKAFVEALNEGESLKVGVEYTAQNAESPSADSDSAILRLTIAGLTDVQARILDVTLTANTNQDEQLGVFTFVNGSNTFQTLVFFDQEGQQDPTAAFLGFDINYDINSNVSLQYIDAFAGESGDSTGQTSESIKVKNFVLGQDDANVDIVDPKDGVNIGISNPTNGLQGDAVVNMNDPASSTDSFERVGGWSYSSPADDNDRVAYDGTTGTPQNGGAGIDILETIGNSIDLTLLDNAELQSFEVISLKGAATQSLKLSAADVLEVTDGENVLHVIGGPEDSVNLAGGGWSFVGADTAPAAGIQGEATYFGWVQFLHTSGAKVLVDPDMTVNLLA